MENLAKNIGLLIPIIKEKEYQIESFVMGYHVYRNIWSPKEKDILNTEIEPSNVMDKFAMVIKITLQLLGIYQRERLVVFVKQFFIFSKYRENPDFVTPKSLIS